MVRRMKYQPDYNRPNTNKEIQAKVEQMHLKKKKKKKSRDTQDSSEYCRKMSKNLLRKTDCIQIREVTGN